jgi:hypothetical protein
MPRDGAMTLVDECEPTLAVRKEWMGRSLLALALHHFDTGANFFVGHVQTELKQYRYARWRFGVQCSASVRFSFWRRAARAVHRLTAG